MCVYIQIDLEEEEIEDESLQEVCSDYFAVSLSSANEVWVGHRNAGRPSDL